MNQFNYIPRTVSPPGLLKRLGTKAATAAAAIVALAANAQVDRSSELDPNWPAPPMRDTEVFYPKRVGLGKTPFKSARPDEVSEARNPADAARRVDATNRRTTPHDLDVIRKDGQPGIGYSSLSTDQRESSADRTARSMVEQGVSGKFLNTDPKSIEYIRNASGQMNLGALNRLWEWAFGSARFIRISASGTLAGSVGAGTAEHSAQGRIVGAFFGRTRELVKATLDSTAPSSPSAQKTARLRLQILGRNVVDEIVSDAKPYVRNLKHANLLPLRDWWSGSISVPWLGLGLAFRMNSDPVTVTGRIAVGHASTAGEAALTSGLETLAEYPLLNLWGFAKILARCHFKPLEGSVIGGNSVGFALASGQPALQDARYVRGELAYGAVNLKIKAVLGFKIFGWGFEKDKTLWSVFRHDGRKVSRELVSFVRTAPLR